MYVKISLAWPDLYFGAGRLSGRINYNKRTKGRLNIFNFDIDYLLLIISVPIVIAARIDVLSCVVFDLLQWISGSYISTYTV